VRGAPAGGGGGWQPRLSSTAGTASTSMVQTLSAAATRAARAAAPGSPAPRSLDTLRGARA